MTWPHLSIVWSSLVSARPLRPVPSSPNYDEQIALVLTLVLTLTPTLALALTLTLAYIFSERGCVLGMRVAMLSATSASRNPWSAAHCHLSVLLAHLRLGASGSRDKLRRRRQRRRPLPACELASEGLPVAQWSQSARCARGTWIWTLNQAAAVATTSSFVTRRATRGG